MSSVKSVLPPFQNFIDAVMSGTNTVTSAVTNIQNMDNVGIQLNFTGTPNGTFDVQISSDYAADSRGNVVNAGHWVSLPLSPAPAAAGSADQIYIDLNQLSAPWIRVQYTNDSGSGVLNGYITAKRLGG